MHEKAEKRILTWLILALLVLISGVLLMFSVFDHSWPAILIIVGIILLVTLAENKDCNTGYHYSPDHQKSKEE